MARYRKIDPRIWNDAKFRALSDGGKLVFFMLLSHPSMTALGAMRATLPGLSAEMGWAVEAFAQAFAEVSSKGMAEHDADACFIALPNFQKYNQPESPNVVKAWAGALDLLPECRLKTKVLQRSQGFAEGMSEGFRKAFFEAFPKGMPYQEQEQEPEQEQIEASDFVGVASRPVDQLWGSGLQFLIRKGMQEEVARRFLGGLLKHADNVALIALLVEAEAADVVDPKSWLSAAVLRRKPTVTGLLPRDDRSDDELEAANRASMARFAGAHA